MDGSGTTIGRIFSGIGAIDRYWHGFFRGGRYLAYGRTASGRNLLPVIFLDSATQNLETSLLVTRLRNVDLYIQASSVGFDAQSARNSGLLRISRIPAELEVLHSDDESIESALKALASLIVDAGADRVVIDDFSPFSRISSFDHFRTAFIRLLDEIELTDSTILIGMPEPANDASRRIIELMASLMTGSVHVHVTQHDGYTQRTLSLIPRIGHATHRFDVPWDLDDLVARAQRQARYEEEYENEYADAYEEDYDEYEEYEVDDAEDAERPAWPGDTGPEDAGVTEEDEGEEARALDGRPPERPPEEVRGPATEEAPGTDLGDTNGHEEQAPELTAADQVRGQAFEDRDRFTDELQLYFEDFESSGTPFTLVAMRMEEAAEQSSEHFRVIIRLVGESIEREDSMFADPESEKIIIIRGEGDDSAQGLFSRVKERVRQELPDQAEALMNAVSAVVVKNGSPFITANEFLQYVLDED